MIDKLMVLRWQEMRPQLDGGDTLDDDHCPYHSVSQHWSGDLDASIILAMQCEHCAGKCDPSE